MMINILYSGLGAVLGLIFFGGLKLTLQKTSKVRHPALLVILSYFLRMGILLGGLALLAVYAGLAGLIFGTLGLTIIMISMLLVSRREGAA